MTDKLLVKEKDIVVPGELLAHGMSYLPSQGTYRKGEDIYAGRLGLMHVDGKVLKLQPVSGAYLPKIEDVIIVKVTDVLISGWRTTTNSAYAAVLSLKEATSDFIARGADLTQYYNIGDWLMARVINVTSQNLVDLSLRGPGLRKLSNGRAVRVNPYKVPRIIGKHGSMLNLIKEATGVRIYVGQNGIVWVAGDPENEIVVTEALELIQREAHISGLTDRVKKFLEDNKSRLVEPTVSLEEEREERPPRRRFDRNDHRGGDRRPRNGGFQRRNHSGGFQRRGPPRRGN